MVVLLLVIVGMGLGASLLPFLVPDSLLSLLGMTLNHALGELLAGPLRIGEGTLLVTRGAGGLTLTLVGVLVVYFPILIALVFVLRR